MVYIATFFTHYGAMSFCKELRGHGVTGKMMPVPRALSSSCGTCVQFETAVDIRTFGKDDVEKLFSLQDDAYQLLYENAEL